jgi:hypothetical protein
VGKRFILAMKYEDQPWYPQWREAVERVGAAQMTRDSAMPGPDQDRADREYEAALAIFPALAEQIRDHY